MAVFYKNILRLEDLKLHQEMLPHRSWGVNGVHWWAHFWLQMMGLTDCYVCGRFLSFLYTNLWQSGHSLRVLELSWSLHLCLLVLSRRVFTLFIHVYVHNYYIILSLYVGLFVCLFFLLVSFGWLAAMSPITVLERVIPLLDPFSLISGKPTLLTCTCSERFMKGCKTVATVTARLTTSAVFILKVNKPLDHSARSLRENQHTRYMIHECTL